MTRQGSTVTEARNESTATPADEASEQTPTNLEPSQDSQPDDTQAFSQFVYPPRAFADEVEDETAEGVWGYLIPLYDKANALVLRKRDSCENKDEQQGKDSRDGQKSSRPPGGYLIGRHPECGR